MSVTFKCEVVRRTDTSTRIKHNGKEINVGPVQCEKLEMDGYQHAVITIPDWLYEKEFEAPEWEG